MRILRVHQRRVDPAHVYLLCDGNELESVSLRQLGLKGLASPREAFSQWRTLREAVARRPDIALVSIEGWHESPVLDRLVDRLADIDCPIVVHSSAVPSKLRTLSWTFKRLLDASSGVASVNEHGAIAFRDLAVPGKRIATVGHWSPICDMPRLRFSWQDPDRPVDVLFFARLIEEKGLRDFVAMAERFPTLSFAIAGRGPLESFAAASAERLGNVRFLGYVGGAEEKRRLLSETKYLFSAMSGVENFGISILEAARSGALPLTTRDAGPELILGRNYKGFARRADEIAKGLERVLTSKGAHEEVADSIANSAFYFMDRSELEARWNYAFGR